MKRLVPLFLLALAFAALHALPAQAQATRTWISGVGDDANPCSRTAPCKTFAGAISKTATSGEINCLDQGGFGGLTITKSIAIICQGVVGGVLVAGTNGFTVNAAGAVVYLQGLDFEGLGGPGSVTAGLSGISFLSGASLYIKDCIVRGFGTNGINIAPSQATNSTVVIENTVVADNATTTPTPVGGVLIAPTGGGTATVLIRNSHLDHNLYGVRVQDGGKVTVENSTASNNSNNGFLAASTASAAELNVANSVSSGNGTNGVETSGGNALIRLSNVTITDNGTGINTVAGGTITSTTPASVFNAGSGTQGAPNGTPVSLQ